MFSDSWFASLAVAGLAIFIGAGVIPEFVAIEIAGDDDGVAGEPLRIVDDGLVELADIALEATAWNGHGPDGDQEKIAGKT